ncbi:MAG: tRNA lysidine(34) synthetase TilS [Acidobacteriota bacterium]|nr:tRNA lysidine(34) synthetase TilS [Acidobacteriota bacterium]
MRVAVALSGGADSVALLLVLHERAAELGLVLSAAHLHHGLRGGEADADRQFCHDLCAGLGIPLHTSRVDTAAEAAKAGEGIEEAARRLRYAWFRELAADAHLDATLTAHTLDDQAETVLAKFLRGAWTEGLSGIHPTFDEGRILRPLLNTTRAEIEAFLRDRNQPWQEDSTNRQTYFTRNRIRHELLPELEKWNPRVRAHLANMATLARDEEAAWDAEVSRLAPQLILPGKPVRGGGRSATGGLAMDTTRLATLNPALQRRLLRHAAAQLGCSPDFTATESMRRLALTGHAGQKLELAGGLRVERSHRELRLAAGGSAAPQAAPVATSYTITVPGQLKAATYHCQITIEATGPQAGGTGQLPPATLRPWKAGDRVKLRYSAAPKKIKEVLERLHVSGKERAAWPLLEWQGRIVWMRGVEVEPDPQLCIRVSDLDTSGGN